MGKLRSRCGQINSTGMPDEGSTDANQVLTVLGLNAGATSGLLGNDTSSIGLPLTASLPPGVTTSNTGGARISVAVDGGYTYDPTGSTVMKALPQGITATDTFTYIAFDNTARSGTVTITVTGVNDAPVAVADAFTVSPNAIFNATAATGLRINDTDPDTGETATLTIVPSALSTPNGAIVSINGDGSFSYDPSQSAAIKALPQGASLTDTFTYTLQDANKETSVGNVTMTVNGINDPVIANNDTTATQTNKAVEIAVLSNDIDPDGNPINIFPLLVNQRTSQGGTITTGSSISTIAYTPPLNFTGTDTFTYTVTDGNSTSSAVVTINVTPAPPPNRPPVVGNDNLTINQGSTVKIDFLANDSDPDGDTFSLASFTNPNRGQVTVEGNQFVYTAPAGFVGNDGFQYTLIDSKGASSSGGVFFAVVQSGAPSPSPSPSPSPTPTPTPSEECTIAIASPVVPAPNAAADTLTGTTSDNLLIGNNNNNTIVSLDGDDLSVGLAGSDNLSGNKGADLLFGNQGNDVIEAGDGDDTLYGGKENDFLNGGLGADTIHADLGDDQVLGGDGNDFIEGGQGGDLIDGGAGNDTIDGGSENDAVKGGDGADVITGGAGSDALQGNAGDDALIGNADADVLDGCSGNDSLTGGDGNDTLYGGSGNDVLDGGLGNDLISGGAGTDRITLAAANGVDTVVNFTLGEDTLVLTGGLTVEQISIIPQNNSTALGLTSSPGTVLAILQGVSSSTITASIFTVG
jgi:large repetitive protein